MSIAMREAKKLLLKLPDVVEGTSYKMPSFLVHGRFFARFRDDDTVLVLQLKAIADRDVLMEIDPSAFFFTDHYRNYPAVLVRLAKVPRSLLADVVKEAWRHVSSMPPARKRAAPRRRSSLRRKRKSLGS
ncbi:MAG: MmcQ/YjbR family DNA-binding protein [Thermoanaerobaculia bacterium]